MTENLTVTLPYSATVAIAKKKAVGFVLESFCHSEFWVIHY